MLPVLAPEEVAVVDGRAPAPREVLVARSGAAVAGAAGRLLCERTGGVAGRRAVVVAGPGGNGDDGRDAAARLRRRGVHVVVVPPGATVPPGAHLVVDAAFGVGLSRPYQAPEVHGAAVLAVDIPSGLSGLTGLPVGGAAVVAGAGRPGAVRADATVALCAHKPGLLLGEGRAAAGRVELAPIGLDGLAAEVATAWLVTDADVAAGVPRRPIEAHKWQSAVQVVAGSPGMHGAPWMVSRAAMRAGAGYVRLAIPGTDPVAAGLPPGEVVGVPLPARDWVGAALEGIERCRALVVGPGLGAAGRGPGGRTGPASPVARLLAGAPDVPAVVDADGLNALGDLAAVAKVVASRRAPTVLTPHAGEYARLTGGAPGDDRLGAVRAAARRSGAVVLLKGSTTVVAEPSGTVRLAAAGTSALATAGTGDVLSGVVGALLARGVEAAEAAALAAHVHGRAGSAGRPEGLVATDLPELVADWLSATLSEA